MVTRIDKELWWWQFQRRSVREGSAFLSRSGVGCMCVYKELRALDRVSHINRLIFLRKKEFLFPTV